MPKQIRMKQPLAYYQKIMKPYAIRIEYCPRIGYVFLIAKDMDMDFSETRKILACDVEIYEGDLIEDWLMKMKRDLEELFRRRMRKALLPLERREK